MKNLAGWEWPTLGLLAADYALFTAAIWLVPSWSLALAVLLAALAIALHSSLSHETIHGHPSRHLWLNALLVAPPLSVTVPWLRFYDMHLAHHRNERLTDPYDDPESNYQALPVWLRRARWQKTLFAVNNTLAGRILIGPLLGHIAFFTGDLRAIRQGDRRVLLAWAVHLPLAILLVALVLRTGNLPWWAFLVALWLGHGILKIRTFLEHQAHEHAGGRTVIIEDRGPLALLFLNNNLHAVHHAHPRVPWYRLWALYRARRERFLAQNQSYRFTSYLAVFRAYLFRAKDPVPHPFWRRD